jgi:hypothetical protein
MMFVAAICNSLAFSIGCKNEAAVPSALTKPLAIAFALMDGNRFTVTIAYPPAMSVHSHVVHSPIEVGGYRTQSVVGRFADGGEIAIHPHLDETDHITYTITTDYRLIFKYTSNEGNGKGIHQVVVEPGSHEIRTPIRAMLPDQLGRDEDAK